MWSKWPLLLRLRSEMAADGKTGCLASRFFTHSHTHTLTQSDSDDTVCWMEVKITGDCLTHTKMEKTCQHSLIPKSLRPQSEHAPIDPLYRLRLQLLTSTFYSSFLVLYIHLQSLCFITLPLNGTKYNTFDFFSFLNNIVNVLNVYFFCSL